MAAKSQSRRGKSACVSGSPKRTLNSSIFRTFLAVKAHQAKIDDAAKIEAFRLNAFQKGLKHGCRQCFPVKAPASRWVPGHKPPYRRCSGLHRYRASVYGLAIAGIGTSVFLSQKARIVASSPSRHSSISNGRARRRHRHFLFHQLRTGTASASASAWLHTFTPFPSRQTVRFDDAFARSNAAVDRRPFCKIRDDLVARGRECRTCCMKSLAKDLLPSRRAAFLVGPTMPQAFRGGTTGRPIAAVDERRFRADHGQVDLVVSSRR